MPATKRCAAVVERNGIGHEDAGDAALKATKTEVDIFQIRAEGFVIAAELFEEVAAKEARGARRGLDSYGLDGCGPEVRRLLPTAGSPRTAGPAY
jgi:hypothetical protein